MIIHDSLYGRFSLPQHLVPLLTTPEVRRLSQIRLINALTPSLATLGELRRYSHTLGVLYLSTRNTSPRFSREEWMALEASVLLHDIGTPPFGHLLEYYLAEAKQWSHEKVIKDILWGFHAPENRAHQIFGGRMIGVQTALKRSGVSFELVLQIVRREHPLSQLLFGTMDLDNLDNVARMAWAIGVPEGIPVARHLAEALILKRDGTLQLSRSVDRDAVLRWAKLRKSVYDVLAFDPPTVAAQAVLSDAIGIAVQGGLLDESDWSLTDEALLERLRLEPATKDIIIREYLGRLPTLVVALQIEGCLRDYGLHDRESARQLVEDSLRVDFPSSRVLGYVFLDNGTFQKELTFEDPQSGELWTEGKTSQSVVLYGFARTPGNVPYPEARRSTDRLLEAMNVPQERIVRCEFRTQARKDHDQLELDVTTRAN